MGLKVQLQSDLATAIKSGDQVKRDAIRSVLSAITYAEKQDLKELDDEGIILVIQKLVKQRLETIADAKQAGRPALIESEEADMAVLRSYFPAMMSRDEIEREAQTAAIEVGAVNQKDMGKVMSVLMPRLRGKADGRLVSEVVKDLLSSSSATEKA